MRRLSNELTSFSDASSSIFLCFSRPHGKLSAYATLSLLFSTYLWTLLVEATSLNVESRCTAPPCSLLPLSASKVIRDFVALVASLRQHQPGTPVIVLVGTQNGAPTLTEAGLAVVLGTPGVFVEYVEVPDYAEGSALSYLGRSNTVNPPKR